MTIGNFHDSASNQNGGGLVTTANLHNTSYNIGTITTGNFYNSSLNHVIFTIRGIVGTGNFYDTSVNQADATTANFHNNSYYDIGSTATTANFYDITYNLGTVPTANFYDVSYNLGTVTTAFFYNNSYNDMGGTVSGTATFRDSSYVKDTSSVTTKVWRDTGFITQPDPSNVVGGTAYGTGSSLMGTRGSGINGTGFSGTY